MIVAYILVSQATLYNLEVVDCSMLDLYTMWHLKGTHSSITIVTLVHMPKVN